jgi:hypothetical protein
MGCHTWFLNRISDKSEGALKVVREIIKQQAEKNIEEYRTLLKEAHSKNTNSKDVGTLNELIHDDTKLLNFLETLSPEELEKSLCSIHAKRYKYISGYGACERIEEFHDVFRIYTYPSDLLCSFDETIQFIEENKDNCKIFEYTYNQLKKFWDEYPQGLICFG